MVKYYTNEEVAMHNCADDCWVSIHGDVYDISSLLTNNRGNLAQPLIKEAGKSISHWFNKDTRDVVTYIDPEKQIRLPYIPQGRFIHVPPSDPTEYATSYDLPWWKDEQYIVGKVTTKPRLVKIVNMQTRQEHIINTCQEEILDEIIARYIPYNKHARSYTWKALINDEFVQLDMHKTLEDNDVKDESKAFYELGMDEDFYIPTLHIYFNDDLTYA